MIDIAFKNLWSHKLRTVLCIFGVMICVFLINTVDGMLYSMRDNISQNLARYMGKISLYQKGAEGYNSILKEDVAQKALKLKGLNLKESTPLIPFVIEPGKSPFSGADVAGIGITPGKERAQLSGEKIKRGRMYFYKNEVNSAIVSEEAVDYFKARLGKQITIKNKKAKVIGILKKSNNPNLQSVAIVPLAFAQKVARAKGEIAYILLTAKDIEDVDKITKAAEKKFPDLDVVTVKQVKENAESMMEMPNKFLGMISKTVFLVTLVLISIVMIIAVRGRIKEIGTLRAIGTSRRLILLTIFYEALFIGFIGGFLGVLITIPASYLLDWAWILAPQNMAKIFTISIIAGSLGGLYPAWQATKIDPLEALRYE